MLTSKKQDTFLIIEDQKSMAHLLKSELSKLTHLPIHICHSFADLIALLKTGVHVEVCLSDMNLPDAPKGEAIKFLLEQNITTIVLTGTYNDDVREQMLKLKVADYVLKDGISSIQYAVHTADRIYNNIKKQIWLLSTEDEISSKLVDMLRVHRYPVTLYTDESKLQADLKNDKPDLLLIDSTKQAEKNNLYGMINKIRQLHSQTQLPILACESSAQIKSAIKLMKYGVNDFYNTHFSAEEFYVRVHQNTSQSQCNKKLEDLSKRDLLTGLFNREHFFDKGRRIFNDIKQENKYFFVLMADIDFLKQINDTHGYKKGDNAIFYTAQQLKSIFPESLIARFSEKFYVFGEVKDAAETECTCEIFRNTIETNSEVELGTKFTISMGLTFSENALELAVKLADEALYSAKKEGRNKISVRF